MNWIRLFRFLLILLASIKGHSLVSQDPVSFTLGKFELKDFNVYNLLETKNRVLYIATNAGLFRYENEIMYPIPFRNQSNHPSLFHLVQNSKGDIFCIDLKGSIYKVVEDKLTLFYSLDNEYIQKLPTLFCDSNDHLVVTTSKKCFTISPKGTLLNVIEGKLFIHQLKDKSFFYLFNNQWVYVSSKKKQTFDAGETHVDDMNYMAKVLYLMHWLSSQDNKYQDNIPKLNDVTLPIPLRVFDRIYQASDTSFFVRRSSSSFYRFEIEHKSIICKEEFFKKTFISCFEQGDSGVLYFGTFKQGVRVVPNLQTRKFNSTFEPNTILDLAVSQENDLFFSIYRKGIYKMDNGRSKRVFESDIFPYSKIFYSKNIFNPKRKKYVFNEKLGAFKDLKSIDENTDLLLTHSHLFLLSKKDTFFDLPWVTKFSLPHYRQVFGRNKSLEFSKGQQKLFLGNLYNLYEIDRGKSPKAITFHGKVIEANDLSLDRDTLWIGDSKFGVLAYIDHQVIQMFSTKDGLLNNRVTRLIKKNHMLYLIIDQKLCLVNTHTREVMILGKSDGIVGLVNNIKVSKDKLWVLVDNSIVNVFHLNDMLRTREHTQLHLSRVTQDDQSIDFQKVHAFHVKNSSLTFSYRLQNVLESENFDLCYNLDGTHNEQHCIPFKNNKIVYKTLPVGEYSLSAYAKSGSFKSNKFEYHFRIDPPLWKENWFIFLSTFILVSLIAWIIYFYVRKLKRKNEQQLLKSKMKSDIIEYKLKSMRSQMNPHFIFNSLNSIQALVLQSEPILVYDYIEMFAQLVRKILTFSDQNFISLSEEVAFLKVYMQLESLRFDELFSYEIKCNENTNVKIPSLLIQPFVENALHHGLITKKGDKRIHITFEQEGELMVCTVEDNGIGRAKSMKHKNHSTIKQNSFAMNSIKSRMTVFKNKYSNPKIGFEVIDLSQDQNPSGTRVVLKMPIQKV